MTNTETKAAPFQLATAGDIRTARAKLIFFGWDLRIQLVPSLPLNNAFTAKIIIHLHLLVSVTDDFWRSDPDSHWFKNHRRWCYPVRSFPSFDSHSIWTPVDHAEFSKSGRFLHALSLKRSRWPPFLSCFVLFFFVFLTQVTHYLTAVKIKKISIDWKIFARASSNTALRV